MGEEACKKLGGGGAYTSPNVNVSVLIMLTDLTNQAKGFKIEEAPHIFASNLVKGENTNTVHRVFCRLLY